MPSTAIQRLRYNAAKSELTVTFTSGRRYVYAQVPPEVFTAFNEAPSQGAFFNAEIRDIYRYWELKRARV